MARTIGMCDKRLRLKEKAEKKVDEGVYFGPEYAEEKKNPSEG